MQLRTGERPSPGSRVQIQLFQDCSLGSRAFGCTMKRLAGGVEGGFRQVLPQVRGWGGLSATGPPGQPRQPWVPLVAAHVSLLPEGCGVRPAPAGSPAHRHLSATCTETLSPGCGVCPAPAGPLLTPPRGLWSVPSTSGQPCAQALE